jgi:FAD/FMN-containing dehydrogenase
MLTTNPLADDLSALRAELDGQIVLPGEEAWDDARMAWNLAADQRPALVGLPRSAHDVQALVGYAGRTGLRVAMQGTGHNATPLGPLGDTLLIKTHEMRGVTIDAIDCVARVEAGALWVDVTAPASELGLAPLAGSSPDVGVVGYTLGGGLSWLGRRYGLAAERLLAVELVTADGRFVRATRHEHADLFWALRGGGGNFGAVTAIEFELIPLTKVYAGMLMWPVERAREVMQAWREWTTTAPETVTTSFRVLHLPPLPELPEFLRGRSVAVIDGASLGEETEAAAAIAGLRALEPELDTFAMIPPVGLSYIHMDPEDPMPGRSDSRLLDTLPAEAVDAFVELASTPGPVMLYEMRHIGGALGRRGTGALGSFRGSYLMFAAGLAADAGMAYGVETALVPLMDALAPYGSGAEYLNFAERKTDPRAFYGELNYARLKRIKAQVDPGNLFRGNHEIPAAG